MRTSKLDVFSAFNVMVINAQFILYEYKYFKINVNLVTI